MDFQQQRMVSIAWVCLQAPGIAPACTSKGLSKAGIYQLCPCYVLLSSRVPRCTCRMFVYHFGKYCLCSVVVPEQSRKVSLDVCVRLSLLQGS